MEVEDSDTELYSQEEIDDDEKYDPSGSTSKLQFRKETSMARWSEKMGMAEVFEKKGRIWTTTGVVRSGKLYCTIEEALFLAEIGALVLLGDGDAHLSLKDMYEKVVEKKNGTCWECFEIYRHMKSLGYVLRRHGMLWTVKSAGGECTSADRECASEIDVEEIVESREVGSVVDMFGSMKIINRVRPVFDVYLPNSKFRKSAPGDPSFIICVTGDYPPSKTEIEALERQCADTPLKKKVTRHSNVFSSPAAVHKDILHWHEYCKFIYTANISNKREQNYLFYIEV